jgi:hypothetical protein
MKPDNLNQSPSFDLPAPNPEAGQPVPPLNPELEVSESNGETPIKAELPIAAPAALNDQTIPVSSASAVDPVTMAAPPPAVPAAADDADLIEKEWVEKAKALVEQTKDDPHAQNRALNRFKADYMKKRYNKDLLVE